MARYPGTRLAAVSGRGTARADDARAAFTLIEMLLVIALIGLMASLFVVNLDMLAKQTELDAVESGFWKSVREARAEALLDRRAQSLRYEAKTATFLVTDEVTGEVRSFPIKRDDWAPETRLEISLLKRLGRNQFTIQSGELVDLREVPVVHFFPDGAITPFVVRLQVGPLDKQIEIDPWTGAEMLKRDEE